MKKTGTYQNNNILENTDDSKKFKKWLKRDWWRLSFIGFFLIGLIGIGVLSRNFIDNNFLRFNLEWSGSYNAQLTYHGAKQEAGAIAVLEQRIDPLSISDINVQRVMVDDKSPLRFNVAVSKSSNYSQAEFISQLIRKGYLYILDEAGNDLCAVMKNEQGQIVPRTERLLIKDLFNDFQITNNAQGDNQLALIVKNPFLLQEVIKNLDSKQKLYFMSDIGQLLDYLRNSVDGLITLTDLINNVSDRSQQTSLKYLLANNTPGFADNTGDTIFQDVISGTLKIAQYLPQNYQQPADRTITSAAYNPGIQWIYDDLAPVKKLSFDPNDPNNIYNPAAPFVPDHNLEHSSPMNAWLPHIKKLVFISNWEQMLHKLIINEQYASYVIGELSASALFSNQIILKHQFGVQALTQITSLLQNGKDNSYFELEQSFENNGILNQVVIKIFNWLLIAVSIIVFGICLFRYRLIGLIMFAFVGLFLFTVIDLFVYVQGVFSFEIGFAFIFSLSLLLYSMIIFIERIKTQQDKLHLLKTTINRANEASLWPLLNITALSLVMSLGLFWIGIRSVRGYAIALTLGLLLVFGFMLLFRFIILTFWNFDKNAQLNFLWISNTQQKNLLQQIEQAETEITAPEKKAKQYRWQKWVTYFVIVAAVITTIISSSLILFNKVNFNSGFQERYDIVGFSTVNELDNYANEIVMEEKRMSYLWENNALLNKYYNNIESDVFVVSNIETALPGRYGIKIRTNIQNNLALVNNLITALKNNVILEKTYVWSAEKVIDRFGNEIVASFWKSLGFALGLCLVFLLIRFNVALMGATIVTLIINVVLILGLSVSLYLPLSTNFFITTIFLFMIYMVVITNLNLKIMSDMELKTSTKKLELLKTLNLKKVMRYNWLFIALVWTLSLILIFFSISTLWPLLFIITIGTGLILLSSYTVFFYFLKYGMKYSLWRKQKHHQMAIKHFADSKMDEHVVSGIND